ncbi:uncharacterized protein [Littorina saxatilis]|uniref:FAM234A/B beta-propeller domain-containing protein n=2 Tax=Littorina saxatilis TaxID=31220 RepID=A0AAN9GKH9_9CAEN
MSGKSAQYSPLLQSVPSDEEDDGLEFRRGDENNIKSSEKHDALPMYDLGSPAPNAMSNGFAVRNRRRKTRRNVIVVVVVSCALLVAALVSAAFVILGQEVNAGIVHGEQYVPYGDWTLFFNNSASEASVFLTDVDGDGLDDILVGITSLQQYMKTQALLSSHTMKQSCLELEFLYPCLGEVVALRGFDHKVLWRTRLRSGLIFTNCHHDISGDHKPDCIFTGRQSTVQAVDLATGKTHWVTDADNKTWSGHFVPEWTVFRALDIPDVDGDGILDFLVTHGGNQSREPEDHDRASGRVVFLSGATGKPIGRHLELPNNKETYMSPVRHTTANGSTYFLFGSGGETVPGDLMIVSAEDLNSYILKSGPFPLHSLFSGKEKGVMVPPVLADLTGDGTADILMSAFEGFLVLYDGETRQELWRRHFTGMESYSTPAPGHYDDDGVLDFLMLWGHGAWMAYDYATVYVISGHDGSILWQTRSKTMQMYSDLSLKTQGSHDLFLFHTIGGKSVKSGNSLDHSGHGALSGSGQRKRRHIGGHEDLDDEPVEMDGSLKSFNRMCEVGHHRFEDSHLTCTSDLDSGKMEILLLDKILAASPRNISTWFPQPHHYSLPVDKNGRHCHNLSPADRKLIDMCVVKTPKPLTGAVGDVDGDGQPDLIQLDSLTVNTIDDRYSYLSTEGDLVLSRLSLAPVLEGIRAKLVPMEFQPWRQFMGSSGNNKYTESKLKVAS